MTNSRAKGARGEREFANLLKAAGFDARRGQQFAGSPDSPDVVCQGLSQFHFEVKRVENLSLYVAMGQAERDAGEAAPVVAHKRNGKPWLVVMRFEDWIELVREEEDVFS